MSNALDYLSWRGDLSFQVSPVNEVDAFLFSQLISPDYTGIISAEPVSLREAAKVYFSSHDESVSNLGVLQSASVLPMLRKLSDCPRFSDILLGSYTNIVCPEKSEQFSAVSIYLPDGTTVVSFRGTDDTIIGWKEDFNFALLDSVPAQEDAARYLEQASRTASGDIIICGHSKGGNLAVYAAAKAHGDVRQRIRFIYNFDGPGFRSAFVDSSEYKSIEQLVVSVLPQNSVVGLLLNNIGQMQVVKSNVAGPMAHDGFNWEVLGTGFVRVQDLTATSKALNKAADDTILNMPSDELKAFIDEFFDILLSTGAATITDFTELKTVAKLETIRSLFAAPHVSAVKNEFLEKLIKTIV